MQALPPSIITTEPGSTPGSNIPSHVIGNPDDLSTRGNINDNISLWADATIGLGVENHDARKALLGTAGNPLGKIRSAHLGAIKLN